MLASIGIPPLEAFVMSKRKELPSVRRRIEALLKKTVANGCTAGEAAAAFDKAEELAAKHGIDPAFRLPQRPSMSSVSAASGPETSKPPPVAGSGRGKGVGRLAERLIVEHPRWTYAEIAAEVNRMIKGAQASEKSVRWYASRMRKRGDDVPLRRRGSDPQPKAAS